MELDEENERVKIHSPKTLQVRFIFSRFIFNTIFSFFFSTQNGDYQLVLKFTGEINDQLKGFYRNKYTTPDGKETRYGASTQFEVRIE